jgi:hypothetical protein
MAPVEVTGIVRAVFGTGDADVVRDWLDRHVRARLDSAVDAITFQAGAIGAVFGLRLGDGTEVVLKALRPDSRLARLRAVVGFQNRLAAAGFGAPAVLDGPASSDGVMAVIEKRVIVAPAGDPHQPAARSLIASSLATQIDLLRSLDGSRLLEGRPGWADWETGAWPHPHDSIFDFSAPVAGFAWIDELADTAAAVLRAGDATLPAVIGHSDWVWQNICISHGAFVAGYDWDSLIYAPEPAIAGLAAGAFTQGSPVPPHDPTPEEVTAFLADYQAAARTFGPSELDVATAASRWVRCYNARCQLDSAQRRGTAPPPGAVLEQLTAAHHVSPRW